MSKLFRCVGFGAAAAGFAMASLAWAHPASEWLDTAGSRARLIAGRSPADGGLMAGLEISMPKGWKTYWRSPGEAGGVPPAFDFSASGNVKLAEPLFPAPARLPDAAGETIGYTDRVIFPILVTPTDPLKPVEIALAADYGVCKDICIPTSVKLSLTVDVDNAIPLPDDLAAALDKVPRAQSDVREGDPRLLDSRADVTGPSPRLVFRVRVPGGAENADAFVEAPSGAYLPSPRKSATDGDIATYEVDLTTDVDIKALKGQVIVATLTGPSGHSEANIPFDDTLAEPQSWDGISKEIPR